MSKKGEADPLLEELRKQEEKIRLGGGAEAMRRQHGKNRLTARERIDRLIDQGSSFFELGLWAAWFGLRDHGFRKHWLLPAVVGFLMPFVVPYPTPPSAPRPFEASMWWAVLWTAFMAASLWDHFVLVRSLGHARGE